MGKGMFPDPTRKVQKIPPTLELKYLLMVGVFYFRGFVRPKRSYFNPKRSKG